MKRLICALALLAGCGGTVDEPGDDLVGDYQAPIEGLICARVLSLHADRTFGSGVGCELKSGQNAVEVHRGTWSATAKTLTMTQTRSSCPGETRETTRVDYNQTAFNLTLIFDDGGLVFERNTPGPTEGGVLVTGCFDADATFTQSPERDL